MELSVQRMRGLLHVGRIEDTRLLYWQNNIGVKKYDKNLHYKYKTIGRRKHF